MNTRSVILKAYREQRGVPFTWRDADCLQWCGFVAKRLIGKDPGEQLRLKYDSEASSHRVMVQNNWSNLGDVAASLLNEVPVAQARSGDWVFCIDDVGNQGLGVVCADQIAVRSQEGLGLLPLKYAQRAFRLE